MRLFRRPSGPLEDWQPRLYAIVIGLGLVVAWVIAFVAKNNDRTQLDFVLFSAHTSLLWLMLLPLVIGFLGGLLVSQLYRRRSARPRDQAAPDR